MSLPMARTVQDEMSRCARLSSRGTPVNIWLSACGKRAPRRLTVSSIRSRSPTRESRKPPMSDSPLSPSPYEVLGVSASVTHEELRRAYRRLLRETHPDTGGTAVRFQAVQVAWELIGDPEDRARYDRGEGGFSADLTDGGRDGAGFSATFHPTRSQFRGATVRARSYGHPGGQARERYLTLMREWAGRGTDLEDPYNPALVRSAPREIRLLLAVALAEDCLLYTSDA